MPNILRWLPFFVQGSKLKKAGALSEALVRNAARPQTRWRSGRGLNPKVAPLHGACAA